jgi:hypothetical protein
MAELQNDVLVDCNSNNRNGGIKRIFVSNRENIDTFTAGSVNDYTSVTMDATSDVWFEVQIDDKAGSIISEPTNENGSTMNANTVEATIPKLDKTKAFALQQLVDSCKVIAIVETYNSTGTYNQAFVVGYDEVLKKDAALMCLVAQTLETGLQGQNAYTLTMEGESKELIREYVGTIVAYDGGSNTIVNFGS